MNLPSKLFDERFLEHHRRSTSLAGVTNFIVHRGVGPYRDWMDAVVRLLYGMAFGFLLLSPRSGGGTQQAPHDRD